MSYFPCHAYGSNASLTPLFRLLDDFDSYSRQAPQQRGFRTHVQTFQPKFDVREVEDAYELHGELAGVTKDNLNIEFTDPRTLRVSGRIERSYNSSDAPAATPAPEATNDAAAESTEGAETPKRNSWHATVEDDDEFENIDTPSSSVKETASVNNEAAKEDDTQVAAAPQAEIPKETKPADKARYWVSERSIGQFSRTFNFPVQIQQDAVTANLNEGILSVRIPKAPAHEGRRRILLF